MRDLQLKNPYANLNRQLFRSLRDYSLWSEEEFTDVITAIEHLPKPASATERDDLVKSRLGETIPNFVRIIASGNLQRSEIAKRLEQLWKASQQLAECFESRGYTAFIDAEIKNLVSPSLLESLFDTAVQHGVKLTPTYFEGILAIGVREAIRQRDLKKLKDALDRAQVCGLQFQTFNWGMFAKETTQVEDEAVFELIWSKTAPNQFAFNAQAWVTFSDGAGQVERADLLEDIFDSWLIHGNPADDEVWGSCANAAARVRDENLLQRLWTLSDPVKHTFQPATWGAFAKAAGRTGRGDLLNIFWESLLSVGPPLDSGLLSAFSIAAGEAKQGDLVQICWEAYSKSSIVFEAEGFGTLAYGAGYSGRADLLKEIFCRWHPGNETLSKGEHKTWSTFFAMALLVGDEEFLLEVFRKLATLVDPIRFRDWGTITIQLWRLLHRVRNKDIAAEIKLTLIGLRLDVDKCLTTLATTEPAQDNTQKYKPFEGASRCLMKWLVNSYFAYGQQEFESRAYTLVDGLMKLERNQKRAWLEFLCRSQETYFGCLKSAYYQTYQQYFRLFEGMNDQEFVEAIRDGVVTTKVLNFENEGLLQTSLPSFDLKQEFASQVIELLPIREFLWGNLRRLAVDKQIGDKESFFSDAAELLHKVDIEKISRDAWVHFLTLLIGTLARRLWEIIISQAPDSIHNLKRSFEWTFQNPLANKELTEEQEKDLARYAREFLNDLTKILGRSRFGELKPISIASLVKARFLAGANPTNFEVRTPFRIAAWDGARTDVLIPMFKEIRFNADRALRTLSEDERTYEVFLKYGEDSFTDFGILTVSNAFREAAQDKLSTGYGKAIIQRLAASLGGGAESFEEERAGQRIFTWKIYLPLLKLEPNASDD